jgi:hypothetical protein
VNFNRYIASEQKSFMNFIHVFRCELFKVMLIFLNLIGTNGKIKFKEHVKVIFSVNYVAVIY